VSLRGSQLNSWPRSRRRKRLSETQTATRSAWYEDTLLVPDQILTPKVLASSSPGLSFGNPGIKVGDGRGYPERVC